MLSHYPKPPYPTQKQPMPGSTAKMDPRPDHGESSYTGAGKLQGKRAVITGGDSGIGRAVAIAYAREGADILIAYLNENDDAQEVKALIEKEGRRAVLVAGDLAEMLARKGIRANAVAPGPVWTPLIPSTMPDDAVKNFSEPRNRPNWQRPMSCWLIRYRATPPEPPSRSPAASLSSRRSRRLEKAGKS